MGITLVCNPGSTSRKYAWYRNTELLFTVIIETTPSGIVVQEARYQQAKQTVSVAIPSLANALEVALERAHLNKIFLQKSAITCVAMRVVAPGLYFTSHRWLDAEYVHKLATQAAFVPIHIPIVQQELAAVQSRMPDIPILMVSDSAFHTQLDVREAKTGLAQADAREGGWQRFGYHGISCASVLRTLKAQRPQTASENIIVCHVGGGVSIMAVSEGKSVATSMGVTPASGVMMGTRGGDMSADELLLWMQNTHATPAKAWHYLYNQTGFTGLVGEADLRKLFTAYHAGDSEVQDVLRTFIYQIQTYIAQYTILLQRVDRLVLTATALERNEELRAWLLQDLQPLGYNIDTDKNQLEVATCKEIAQDTSIPVTVVATQEMNEIAHIAVQYQTDR